MTPPQPPAKHQTLPAPMSTLGGNDSLAYFGGKIIPMRDANVSVATHALHYGTGCFEGIRAYWNADQEQLSVLRLREHYERFSRSRRLLKFPLRESVDDLCAITLELLRRQAFRQDVYIRPLAFKSAPSINLVLSGLEDALCIFAFPLGDYVDSTSGLHVCISAWRRISNNAIPIRAKTTGGYINSILATEDAHNAGYDEAIFLTESGAVSEGSSSNLFLLRRGELCTPRLADDILEGITRACVMEMAEKDFALKTIERAISRTELYDADELFFTGTGMQIVPITRLEGRLIGNGQPGPFVTALQQRYVAAARGNTPAYAHWCTPVSSESTPHHDHAAQAIT
jgi:branched-chain amino acid aminotransferase